MNFQVLYVVAEALLCVCPHCWNSVFFSHALLSSLPDDVSFLLPEPQCAKESYSVLSLLKQAPRHLFPWSHACSLSCEAAEDTEGPVISHASPVCSAAWQDENQKGLCKLFSTMTQTSLCCQPCVQHKSETAPCQPLWRELALPQPKPVEAPKAAVTAGDKHNAWLAASLQWPVYTHHVCSASAWLSDKCELPLWWLWPSTGTAVWKSQIWDGRRIFQDFSCVVLRWDIVLFSCSVAACKY